MIRSIVLAFAIWSGTSFFVTGQADTLASLEEARALTDRVMEKVSSGDLRGGVMLMKPYAPVIPPAEFEATIGQSELQAPMKVGRFGESLGFEFLCEEKVGESLVKIVQLQKFEKHAMVWVFIFYKARKDWMLNTFYSHDRLQTLLN